VTITNKATKKSMTYQIVSEKEADLKLQKISVTSPIGKGLLGKKVGDEAEIQAPNGKLVFQIDNISI
jgi:transcription elongation factor GreA